MMGKYGIKDLSYFLFFIFFLCYFMLIKNDSNGVCDDGDNVGFSTFIIVE